MPSLHADVAPGLPGELAYLGLDEVKDHLDNYLGNYLLDPTVASVYLMRLANDQAMPQDPEALARLRYLAGKYARLLPLSQVGLQVARSLQVLPEAEPRLAVLNRINPDPASLQRADDLRCQGHKEEARRLLLKLLSTYSFFAEAADMLLDFGWREGAVDEDALAGFKCPGPLAGVWQERLFSAHAGIGSRDRALELWESMDHGAVSENALNLAAELHAAGGDRDKAIALYARSVSLDPHQIPARMRLDELRNPTTPDCGLLERHAVTICLYSWNKADMLRATLESLARSRIGSATILVLLNGCTDHSRDVVEQAVSLFPDNPVRIISLPVNVGAPAARNWLIAEPEACAAEYVAFLDDDVEVPPDWLAHFLTQAVNNPSIGVVGCKVIHPGTPALYQYLYRNVAVARHDLLRISLDTPNTQYDTGCYGFARDTDNVMGCCHLLSRRVLDALPSFDLRFSPSQMDDIAHDLEARLLGFTVRYCGLVTCVHHQNSGVSLKKAREIPRMGNVLGNEIKFFYKFVDRLDKLGELRNPRLRFLPENPAQAAA